MWHVPVYWQLFLLLKTVSEIRDLTSQLYCMYCLQPLLSVYLPSVAEGRTPPHRADNKQKNRDRRGETGHYPTTASLYN